MSPVRVYGAWQCATQTPSNTVTLIIYGSIHMREFAKEFYATQAWRNARNAAIKRDSGLCQDCLEKGLVVPAEEVHHIIELTPENITDESIALNLDNLICLCRECHRRRHGAKRRRYFVDKYGRVHTE